MKHTFVLLIFTFCSQLIMGQKVEEPYKLKPTQPFENVLVQRLTGDSLSSTFIIWIKREVKPHYHNLHSEVVIVQRGKGVMRLGDSTFKIKKGDLIFIPKGIIHSVTTSSRKPLQVLSIQSPHFDGSDRVLKEY